MEKIKGYTLCELELETQKFCQRKDFKDNGLLLKNIKSNHYLLFLKILMYGSEIKAAIKIIEVLTKISKRTQKINEEEVLEVCMECRFIELLFDIKDYS